MKYDTDTPAFAGWCNPGAFDPDGFTNAGVKTVWENSADGQILVLVLPLSDDAQLHYATSGDEYAAAALCDEKAEQYGSGPWADLWAARAERHRNLACALEQAVRLGVVL